MNLSYCQTPAFLSKSLHLLSCISIPIHLFGVYIILCKTPEPMRTVKWSMFNLHVWSVLLDLSISLLTSPFVLFPALAGFPLGFLKELDVSTGAQIYLVVTVFAVVGVAVLGIFENRFYVMFALDSFWRYFRFPFFLFNHFIAVLFFVPPYLSIPNQNMALDQIFQDLAPDLPEWIKIGPIFVLTTDIAYSFVSILLIAVFIIAEILFFIFLIWLNMQFLTKTMSLSKATLRLQRKFLNAIHIQLYTPLVALIIPLLYFAYSVYFDSYNQAYNNISFIIISCHGLISTLIMLFIHKPYREICRSIFCGFRGHKTSPAARSRGLSIAPNQL
ncbi:Serpentine Receptor, class H [Caenorhabditis elegans]|uniref:Serpentine Receptor, class H n=1 Tax=Caenorhabditis elegans TaxID=6239 RepID=O45163_CAEEL|nr:Serpentine Receptor, class H [Caenorhabditis elegans]CCD66316.2 Serpentine Receptor, class H [Caenorhabditis elegans]|eukprot:NP_503776.3 Serpentine Receptor, class H [Caenorhabditis elegans]